MELICGGLLFQVNNLRVLEQFLPDCFYKENYTLLSENEHLLRYQNFDYKLKITPNIINEYLSIHIYSNNPYYNSLNKNGVYKNGGFPELLRSYLCFILEKDYLEVEFFSPITFEKIIQMCSLRNLNHSTIRQYFGVKFHCNSTIKDNILVNSIEQIAFQTDIFKIEQPWFINLKVSEKNHHKIEEFFLQVSISLDWDNQIFFDTIFLPMNYPEMINRFKINESKEFIQSLNQNEFRIIYLVTQEDNLSFLIETEHKYIYIEEVFWWS